MSAAATWGVIATVRAPDREILAFAAHHLELGAHRLYLYLDADAREAQARLAAHPKIRVVRTDDAWWAKRKGRPEKHQSRQFVNARHALNRRADCDWLAHIDVDEFLWPERDIGATLAALPADCLTARVRPIEALAPPAGGPPVHFKATHAERTARQAAAERVYGAWAAHLPGGFLSHVQGKLFIRTGHGLKLKIHNAWLGDTENPGLRELAGVRLCHLHAPSWEAFHAHYRYRLSQGSYRAELRPQASRAGLNLHALFRRIEAERGAAGLRAFFEEVAVAHPPLLARLEAEGLLHRCDLALDETRARHFPD
ncbi:glycosyltransferase family 2 protein [Rhodosalinus halophilus]|uniref:Glycosyltransferase family 2 protein n=1 Tax=Rhodosalinus halophilus TaxID=2259333 RepID=A0A365U747_9RHOB|nr:glycosyltransferase family 2 protein [Rhodosalinus halophilus]RBI84243.1 glycosyltransferase family 2 protein [Rhodosalinus halophilus]